MRLAAAQSVGKPLGGRYAGTDRIDDVPARLEGIPLFRGAFGVSRGQQAIKLDGTSEWKSYPAGTAFEDIPETWFCPVCGARKRDFEPYDD